LVAAFFASAAAVVRSATAGTVLRVEVVVVVVIVSARGLLLWSVEDVAAFLAAKGSAGFMVILSDRRDLLGGLVFDLFGRQSLIVLFSAMTSVRLQATSLMRFASNSFPGAISVVNICTKRSEIVQ
jgi:hypothetical protein